MAFLHIPKTAGQSIRALLEKELCSPPYRYGEAFPFLVESQLDPSRKEAMSKSRLVSGHFNLSTFDTYLGPDFFVFTVLRDPIERILSFYLYLRQNALRLGPSEILEPSNLGKRLILETHPDDYFLGNHRLQDFVDDHFHNFYTRFFSDKTYTGNVESRSRVRTGDTSLIESSVEGISKLDLVMELSNLSQIEVPLSLLNPSEAYTRAKLPRKNLGHTMGHLSKIENLKALGLSETGMGAIQRMTRLDYEFMEQLKERGVIK